MGNAPVADTQSSIQGSVTRDDPIPGARLADDPQHVVDSAHPPPQTRVRVNLLSHLSAHAGGRGTGLEAIPTSRPLGTALARGT